MPASKKGRSAKNKKSVDAAPKAASNQPTVVTRSATEMSGINRTAYWVIALVILLVGIATLFINYNPRHYATTGSGLQLEVSYTGKNGQTALKLLENKYTVKTQHYAGIGDYVTSINGVAATSNYFWAFEVNGKLSDVGAGQYVTKNSDKITWQLEKIQS